MSGRVFAAAMVGDRPISKFTSERLARWKPAALSPI
jgi:hypothetical protein